MNRRDARDSGPWHKRALAVDSTLKVRYKSIILWMGNKHWKCYTNDKDRTRQIQDLLCFSHKQDGVMRLGVHYTSILPHWIARLFRALFIWSSSPLTAPLSSALLIWSSSPLIARLCRCFIFWSSLSIRPTLFIWSSSPLMIFFTGEIHYVFVSWLNDCEDWGITRNCKYKFIRIDLLIYYHRSLVCTTFSYIVTSPLDLC